MKRAMNLIRTRRTIDINSITMLVVQLDRIYRPTGRAGDLNGAESFRRPRQRVPRYRIGFQLYQDTPVGRADTMRAVRA